MNLCPRCQGLLSDPPERFCPHCGVALADTAAAPAAPADEPGGSATPPPPPPFAPPPLPPAGAGYGAGTRDQWPPRDEAEAPRGGIPWEPWASGGLVAGLVDTTMAIVTAPTAFFRAMPVTGGAGRPLLYAVILGTFGNIASAIYDYVMQKVMGNAFSGLGGNEAMARAMAFLAGETGLVIKLVLGPVLVVISVFVFAAVIHAALLVLGGAARGFEATLRVTAYSRAAALVQVIPVCGDPISLVYMLVLTVIGIAEAHGISRGKAAAAVLVVLLVCCCCLLLPLGIAFTSAFSKMQ